MGKKDEEEKKHKKEKKDSRPEPQGEKGQQIASATGIEEPVSLDRNFW